MTSIFLRGLGVDPFPGESTIPRATLSEIEQWLRTAADQLGMRHFRISVSGGIPNGEEATAETFARDSSYELVIALANDFFKWPEPHRRGVLLHELLHGPVHALSIFAREQVEDDLGVRAFAIYEAAIGEIEEKLVDTMGHGLAPLFPKSPDGPTG